MTPSCKVGKLSDSALNQEAFDKLSFDCQILSLEVYILVDHILRGEEKGDSGVFAFLRHQLKISLENLSDKDNRSLSLMK